MALIALSEKENVNQRDYLTDSVEREWCIVEKTEIVQKTSFSLNYPTPDQIWFETKVPKIHWKLTSGRSSSLDVDRFGYWVKILVQNIPDPKDLR